MDYPMTFGVMAGKKDETVARSGNEYVRNPIEYSSPVSCDVNKKFYVLYVSRGNTRTEGLRRESGK
jgi:hypothetical protein